MSFKDAMSQARKEIAPYIRSLKGTPMHLATPANPFTRCMNFVGEYLYAPNSADIEFRTGKTEAGDAAVGVSINGKMHGFTAKEARIIAKIMESALNAHPNEPEAKGLPNAIMGLRAAADAAEKQN